MPSEDDFNSQNDYQDSDLFKKATEILKLANRIAEIAASYEIDSKDKNEQEILRSQA